jgi:protein TonB
MNLRLHHYIGALLLAALLHLALGVWLFTSGKPTTGALASGVGGIEIDLGVAGGMAGLKTQTEDSEQDEEVSEEVSEEIVEAAEVDDVEDTEIIEEEPLDEESLEVAEPEPIEEPKPEPEPEPEETPVEPPTPPEPEKVQETKPPPVAKRSPTPTSEKSADDKAGRGKAGTQAQNNTGSGTAQSAGGNPNAAPDYFSTLAAWLNKHKRYPRRARQRQQQGIVKVQFAIDDQGQVLSHRIVGSSGHRLLDQEVKELLERASPLPPMPTEIQQAQLEITVPIVFSLR